MVSVNLTLDIMWIVHVIAAAAFLFGAVLGRFAYSEGQAIWLVLSWPLGLGALAYLVSAIVMGIAAGSNVRELPTIFRALFSRSSSNDV